MQHHDYDAGYSGMGPCNALVERDGAGDTCGQPADDPAHHPDGGPALPIVGNRPELELISKVMAELGVEHPGDVLEMLEKRSGALVMIRQSRDENRQARQRAEDEVRQLTGELNQAREELNALKAPTRTLHLPVVPPGTVALRGERTGREYIPSRRSEDRWVVADHVVQVVHSLASVLIFEEPEGVTPLFAGPRQPLVWAQLAAVPNSVQAVTVNGDLWVYEYMTAMGVRMYRRAGEPGHVDHARCRSLGHLREIGRVREVID